MKYIEKIFIIQNKSCQELYNSLYEDQNHIFLESIFDIRKYDRGEWIDNKRTDKIEIHFEELPCVISDSLLSGKKVILMKCAHSLDIYEKNHIKIVTKFLPHNSVLIKLMNQLKIFKFKSTLNIDERETSCIVSIKIKISSFFTNSILKNSFESFCEHICESSINHIISQLQTK